jgi:hypothetical protein
LTTRIDNNDVDNIADQRQQTTNKKSPFQPLKAASKWSPFGFKSTIQRNPGVISSPLAKEKQPKSAPTTGSEAIESTRSIGGRLNLRFGGITKRS